MGHIVKYDPLLATLISDGITIDYESYYLQVV